MDDRAVCHVCGRPHAPRDAHMLWSHQYHAQFLALFRRPPTWADATAHLDHVTRGFYVRVLRRAGRWSEPKGVPPIAQEPRYASPATAAETVVT